MINKASTLDQHSHLLTNHLLGMMKSTIQTLKPVKRVRDLVNSVGYPNDVSVHVEWVKQSREIA